MIGIFEIAYVVNFSFAIFNGYLYKNPSKTIYASFGSTIVIISSLIKFSRGDILYDKMKEFGSF